MDELVRKSDVLKLLHGIGGTGSIPETWADGWDNAIDEAFNSVVTMAPVDTTQMENRDAILDALLTAIQLTKDGKRIEKLVGKEWYNGECEVQIFHRNEHSHEIICVTAESGLELIHEVVDALLDAAKEERDGHKDCL